MKKIVGLKKAVGAYQKLNEGGFYSPHYGELMYDKDSGKLWTDEFYSLGHNEWKVYHSKSVINLGVLIEADGLDVTMANVKKYVEKHFAF